jgi:hypothetical protein
VEPLLHPPATVTRSTPNTSVALAPAGTDDAICPSISVSTTQVVSTSATSGSATSRSTSVNSVCPEVTVSSGPSNRQAGWAPSTSASHWSCAISSCAQPISVIARSPDSFPSATRTGPFSELQPALAISLPSSVNCIDTLVPAASG